MNWKVRPLGNLHPSDTEILGPRDFCLGVQIASGGLFNTPLLSAVHYYIALVGHSVIPFLEEPSIMVLNVVTI